MRKLIAAVLAGLGILGASWAEEGKAPPPAPPARPQRCLECNKARMAAMKGEPGYCAHCGVLWVRVQKDSLDKAKEALTQAGATELKPMGPFLTAKVAKDQLEAAKKAVEPFIQKPQPPEEEPEK